MKKFRLAFFLFGVFFITFFSCKKINESTELGGGLIPAVDNVNTFEVALSAITNNDTLPDTVVVGYYDYVALGDVNDPEFGNTHANLAFAITPSFLGSNPFVHPDTVNIDSVVLSLSYKGAWGDTLGNGVQTLRVYEISQGSTFRDDTLYRYKDPNSDFTNGAGIELGSKTFTIRNLDDSIPIRNPADTFDIKVANVVRIKLNNSIGVKFSQFDTSASAVKGGYYLDSTNGGNFRKLFKGLAIKADNSGNALSYFSLSEVAATKLTVYFTRKSTGAKSSADFVHISGGRSNYVKQTPGAQWGTYLANANPSDDKIYLQTAPSGSYASIVIPTLNSMENKVVHLAEIVAPVLPSLQESAFTAPSSLFLDRKKGNDYFIFERDISVNSDFSLNLGAFGGNLKSNAYRFNITRYVQNILTRKESNDTLRLHVPFRRTLSVSSVENKIYNVGVINRIAGGRVVIGGGNFADSTKRLRLRIIYSNL